MNVSSEEANNAILRVFLPKYVSWVNLSDTWTPNITGNLTTNHYIDFDVRRALPVGRTLIYDNSDTIGNNDDNDNNDRDNTLSALIIRIIIIMLTIQFLE